MIVNNFLKELSTLEISTLMAIFGSKYIEKPEHLVFLKKAFFVLTLQHQLSKLPKDGFNRWRIIIENILKKVNI